MIVGVHDRLIGVALSQALGIRLAVDVILRTSVLSEVRALHDGVSISGDLTLDRHTS